MKAEMLVREKEEREEGKVRTSFGMNLCGVNKTSGTLNLIEPK